MNLAWSAAAERDLLEMPWRVAARIARATMLFARTGRGDVRADATGRKLRLVVDAHAVLMTVDPVDGLTVWRVLRR